MKSFVPKPSQFIFKALAACQLTSLKHRFYAYRLVTITSARKRKSRCLVSDRYRGYISGFGVSRLVFKAYAMHGVYPGVKKFVW